jgi:hypothetical protein
MQLMKISDRIRRVSEEILEASIIMATPTNKEILMRLGFRPSSVSDAQESDIIIAIRARDQQSVNLAVAEADRLLQSPESTSKGAIQRQMTWGQRWVPCLTPTSLSCRSPATTSETSR